MGKVGGGGGGGTDLDLGGCVKHVAHEGVEGVPVAVDDVSGDRPQEAECESGGDNRVNLVGILTQVDVLLRDDQTLEQLAEGHHLREGHLTQQDTTLI